MELLKVKNENWPPDGGHWIGIFIFMMETLVSVLKKQSTIAVITSSVTLFFFYYFQAFLAQCDTIEGNIGQEMDKLQSKNLALAEWGITLHN